MPGCGDCKLGFSLLSAPITARKVFNGPAAAPGRIAARWTLMCLCMAAHSIETRSTGRLDLLRKVHPRLMVKQQGKDPENYQGGQRNVITEAGSRRSYRRQLRVTAECGPPSLT